VGTVVIRCPKTGKVVAVGFEAVRDTFHASDNAMATTLCQACGQTHQWQKKDAWVEPVDGVLLPRAPAERRRRPRS
jgi:hypothetical protein